MPSLLLHVCCGPCAIMPAIVLARQGFAVTLWFMNPNIQPLTEYLRRREGALECARRLELEIFFDDGAWDLPAWLERQLPLADSPERCQRCVEQRLAAAHARAAGYDYFCSSLLYSRYQPHEHIAAYGAALAKNGPPHFFYQDFRQFWQEGIDLSKQWGIYRQPYCGCVFSESERYAKKLRRLAPAQPAPENAPG